MKPFIVAVARVRASTVRCRWRTHFGTPVLPEVRRWTIGSSGPAGNHASSSAPLPKLTLEEWNRIFLVNATATFLCTREFTPAMVERRWGRVISVASVAGLEGAKYIAHYSAAKHAVVGFTRSIAVELGTTGVTANAVCPGYVDTQMTDRTLAIVESRAGLSRDMALAAVLATTGQERLITPEEVAASVLELCMEDAGAVTGQAILLRGGVRTP